MPLRDDADMKRCPECAELVQGQARSCRFCGYRFDVPRAPGSTIKLPELFAGILRGPQEPADAAGLLAEWGVELQRGEEIRFWLFARMGLRQGYLVVTDARVCFAELVEGHGYRPVFDHPLESVRAARPEQRGRSLRISGDAYSELVQGLRARDSGRVHEFFAAGDR